MKGRRSVPFLFLFLFISSLRRPRKETLGVLYGTATLDGAARLDGYALVDVNPHASRTGPPELALGWRARFAL